MTFDYPIAGTYNMVFIEATKCFSLVGSLCGYAIKVVTAFDLEVISSKLAWDFTIHQIVPTQIISKRNFEL